MLSLFDENSIFEHQVRTHAGRAQHKTQKTKQWTSFRSYTIATTSTVSIVPADLQSLPIWHRTGTSTLPIGPLLSYHPNHWHIRYVPNGLKIMPVFILIFDLQKHGLVRAKGTRHLGMMCTGCHSCGQAVRTSSRNEPGARDLLLVPTYKVLGNVAPTLCSKIHLRYQAPSRDPYTLNLLVKCY